MKKLFLQNGQDARSSAVLIRQPVLVGGDLNTSVVQIEATTVAGVVLIDSQTEDVGRGDQWRAVNDFGQLRSELGQNEDAQLDETARLDLVRATQFEAASIGRQATKWSDQGRDLHRVVREVVHPALIVCAQAKACLRELDAQAVVKSPRLCLPSQEIKEKPFHQLPVIRKI